MNEALKPDVAERAAPTIPAMPPGRLEPEALPPSQLPPRRRRMLVRIALVLVLAAAVVFAGQKIEKVENSAPSTAEGPNGGRSGQATQTVRVAPVTLGDMPIVIDALGTVTPFETVTIRTQIAGNLMTVAFTEGQIVKKGDFLAQIDPRPYQAALSQAQGQLAKDQALLGQAQNDLSRYEALSKQDSISKQQVADQEALVAQDKAAIVTDQAQVQTAQLNLDYTHIVSPITGRVGLNLSTRVIIFSPPTLPASSSSPRSIRSASSSRPRRTTFRGSGRGSTPAPNCRSPCTTAPTSIRSRREP